MTKKNVTPRPQRGKAAARRAADTLTAERLRAILSDPKTPEGVKEKLRRAVAGLTEWASPAVEETPDFMAQTFGESAEILRESGKPLDFQLEKAAKFYSRVVALAERHEPAAYRVARRCAEIYAAAEGDGAHFFVSAVDAVLEGGEDGLMPNPDSKYFTPLFVEAWGERGARDRKVRALLDLIKRVDEGADLCRLAEEDARAWEEYAKARRPKDVRLVEALSAILRAPTDEQRGRILTAINDLSNETPGVSDLHPDIFPTLARVLIREASKVAAVKVGESGRARRAWLKRNPYGARPWMLKKYLGELEAVAAGE